MKYNEDIINIITILIKRNDENKKIIEDIDSKQKEIVLLENNKRELEEKIKKEKEEKEKFKLWKEKTKFDIETYEIEKEENIEYQKKYNQWITDGVVLENSYKEFIKKEEIIKEKEEDIFQWKRIKSYSMSIKKAIIANTFEEFTLIANEVLKNDSTLGDLQININQLNERKFEIGVNNNGEIKNDISLLSGAEQMVVSKAISLAFASKTEYKCLWFDESDSALSPKNKKIVLETLNKTLNLLDIEQIFVVSHNEDLYTTINEQINLNNYINN